ncbi:MAG: tRNA (N(6)-L-threonylcarbamoyladenosine(37)-C(2))-methylthiotransferase [Candidatus Bathyarchaeota archaeon]|nr:tRNA (N(6)-L-threonylcarbamoyladenosine(37)-C(2))-methylthiotransferase [Candidatus Bathyarchaeota archaeon]
MPSVYVKVYGCSSNTADAEIAKGLLSEQGHRLVQSPKDADINIIMSCIVKTPTEVKITKLLRQLEASGKPLIVAGCMPKAMQSHVEETVPTASLVGPDDIEHIPDVVEMTLNGERVVQVDGDPTDRTCMPRMRANLLVHIAPICTGCLGNCSYCIVKYARGRLYSFPAEQIVEDVRTAVQDGCKEVWVTAEDTAAYNADGVRLPELIDMITSVPGDFMVRVGMMTPNQALPLLDGLIKAYRDPKVFKFLHIPIQSGNDEVLTAMRRRYKVSDFKELVTRMRAAFPDIGVSTDIICGFPGETNEQYDDSLELVKWLKPDVLNISRYWGRPGTDAAKMPNRLHGRETKARSRVLTSLWKELAVDVGKRWLGWEGSILLNELGKGDTKVGRNSSYKTIAVRTDAALGERINVRVTQSGVGFLEAIEI